VVAVSFRCPECGWASEHPEDAEEGYCGHCHAFTLVDFLIDVASTQERIALLVEGIVWEGHVQSCIGGTVVAIVRPAGMERSFEEKAWQLEEIEQMGRLDDEPQDVRDDPLQVYARRLRDQARAHGELSLAERIVQRHFNGEGPDGST
jgi:hypothetical protein